MLCLHCSPPTSDPRAPEQREPHSLLADIDWAPRGLQRLSGNRRPPLGSSPKATRKPPKAAPSVPEIREPGHPRSRHKSPTTAQVRMQRPSGALAEEPDECDPHPLPAEQRTTRRGTATRTPDSQRRQLHHLRL